MTRRRHTAESKKKAARMMIIGATLVAKVAELLGVRSQVLLRWKQVHLDSWKFTMSAVAPSPE
ncbi:hypothetical protein ACWPKS_07650 [Coraliomargarita sp. W4R72]